ncbi:major intrinsic protein [Gregarina niphandrodes]|uniref:Major intrinsic protein n=1 Tax=Gregarina niphandrodes TaxID=110365 RepID=A0A023BBY5_GRENI|nr:major intrinsic protein [Gregarina niphandrodes]EZG81190.1 major intrinsic protein [Gregarina niphandrodes]|eukprot:XP_011134248.1 major intrinsic protein [Gregarina niphandrodes]
MFYEHAWYRSHGTLLVFGSELVGTALLTFTITMLLAISPLDTLVPVAIGALLLALCNIFGELSGAHFNPSITLAVFSLDRRFGWVRCGAYLFAEVLGALLGLNVAVWHCSVLKNPFSVAAHASDHYTIPQMVACEAIYTYIMTMTCLRCAIVVAASYAGGPISGACMNPALAIAFIAKGGQWIDLLVYTVGPLSGCLGAVTSCMIIEPKIWLRRIGFRDPLVDLESCAGPELPPVRRNKKERS